MADNCLSVYKVEQIASRSLPCLKSVLITLITSVPMFIIVLSSWQATARVHSVHAMNAD